MKSHPLHSHHCHACRLCHELLPGQLAVIAVDAGADLGAAAAHLCKHWRQLTAHPVLRVGTPAMAEALFPRITPLSGVLVTGVETAWQAGESPAPTPSTLWHQSLRRLKRIAMVRRLPVVALVPRLAELRTALDGDPSAVADHFLDVERPFDEDE
jgi:hypothetical protein